MPSTTSSTLRSAVRRRTQPTARDRPAGVVGKVALASTAPGPPVTTARVWEAAWVSTPMMRSYKSATIVIATVPFPWSDVVGVGPGSSSRQLCDGSRPGLRGSDRLLIRPPKETGSASPPAPRSDKSPPRHPEGARGFASHDQGPVTTPTLPASPRPATPNTHSGVGVHPDDEAVQICHDSHRDGSFPLE